MENHFRLIILLSILISLSTTLVFNILTFGLPNYNKAGAFVSQIPQPPPPTQTECERLNGICVALEACEQKDDMGQHGCEASETCCYVPPLPPPPVTCESLGGTCKGMFQCWISGGTQNGVLNCPGPKICCTY